VRALLAKKLLEMANFLGENESEMILYLTDPSADNFAVKEDSLDVKYIDLEGLIVVDKRELIKCKINISYRNPLKLEITC
jgi:hypothetical protein